MTPAKQFSKAGHQHKWRVYSTSLYPPRIMVRCTCGHTGGVPIECGTTTDWRRAFWAPSKPFRLRKGLHKHVKVIDR